MAPSASFVIVLRSSNFAQGGAWGDLKAEANLREHKFKIGQLVYFHPKRAMRSQVDAAPGLYHIIKRLPAPEGGEFQYEIRSSVEDQNRVARESELTRA